MIEGTKNNLRNLLPHSGGATKNSLPLIAGWSSLVARQAHNLKAAGSNPAPATIQQALRVRSQGLFFEEVARTGSTPKRPVRGQRKNSSGETLKCAASVRT
jgi:hypothetical protein